MWFSRIFLVLVCAACFPRYHAASSRAMFYHPNTSFVANSVYDAFESLSLQQRMYLHHLSKAAWEGHLINFVQTSPESPLIFILLHRILKSRSSLEEVRDLLISKHNFSRDEVNRFFLYSAAFFANGGNYRGFGDDKFVPEVSREKLAAVAEDVLGKDELDFYAEHCFPRMFEYCNEVRQLGVFPPRGITTYFSANCTEEDGKLVTAFLISKKLDAYNHRVFKTVNLDGKNVYELRFASVQTSDAVDDTPEQLIKSEHVFNGSIFRFTRGDYAGLLGSVNEELQKATKYPRNGQQAEMLNLLMKSFETGSLQLHKKASQIWIKDKLPIVESHFGFIENYRDPAGGRSSFEGIAAVVTIEKTNLLSKVVTNAPRLIESFLPWPKGFEKDLFLAPDFTSLDAIAHSGHAIYSGVNLPNYDEIRQNEGFKNLHFANIIKAFESCGNFVAPRDSDFLLKYSLKAKDVQVIFHELLGHGTGKLLQENQNGSFNFKRNLINPLTGKTVEKWYKHGETYDTVFGHLSSTMEECRAETVGMLLSLEPEALKLAGVADNELSDVAYANCLSMCLLGLRSLKTFDSINKNWGQAHARARFVILNVLQQKLPEFIAVRQIVNNKDGMPDLELTVDRSKIEDAKRVLRDFLLQVQVLKSTADVESAKALYEKLSNPDSLIVSLNKTFSAIKPIVDQRSHEKTILVQPNTFLRDSEAVLWTYDSSVEGLIKSFLDRFNNIDEKYRILKELYIKDMHHFPSKTMCSAPSSLIIQSPSSSEKEANNSDK